MREISINHDWLCLWSIVQQSVTSFHKLLKLYGSPAQALATHPDRWLVGGVGGSAVQRFEWWQEKKFHLVQDINTQIEQTLAWLAQPNHFLLTLNDPEYPELLKHLPDAPPLLFLVGNKPLLASPQVAIVGTRKPSITAKQDAYAMAQELARYGLTITSGLARGIDAAAHAGALAAKGHTIAVLATGPEGVYPRENAKLFQQIVAEGGLLVTEFMPNTDAIAMHFPRRNRVISGLSLGTLVVEAALESGSLITARFAAEQGRIVWALPSSRHGQSQGCLELIREGAILVSSVDQMLQDLPPMLAMEKAARKAESKVEHASAKLDEVMICVLDALGYEVRHADWLIESTGYPSAAIISALSVLEMSGLIQSVPGGYEKVTASVSYS